MSTENPFIVTAGYMVPLSLFSLHRQIYEAFVLQLMLGLRMQYQSHVPLSYEDGLLQ